MANTTNNVVIGNIAPAFKFNKKGGVAPISAFRLNEANRFGMGINPAHVDGLAISISKEGWLNSSVLEVTEDGEIQSGNHRFLAAEKAGYTGEIPYVVVSAKLSETDRLIRAYAANISLGNSPLETALLVGELSRSGMKNKAIAARLFPGKKGSETVVSQALGFVRSAPPWLISAIEDGKISFSQAKEISGEKDIDSKREEIEARTPENPWQKIKLVQGPAVPAPVAPVAPAPAPITEKGGQQTEAQKAMVEKVKSLLKIPTKADDSDKYDLSLSDGVFVLVQGPWTEEKKMAQGILESLFGKENVRKEILKLENAAESSAPAPATVGPESAQATSAKPNPDLALPPAPQPVVITLESIASLPLSEAVSRLLELKDEGDAQKLDEMLAAKHGRDAVDAEVDKQDGEASKADIAPAPATTGQNNPKTDRKGQVSLLRAPARVRMLAKELSEMLSSLPAGNDIGGQAGWIDKHCYITADGRAVVRIMLNGKAHLLTLGEDCVG